MSDLYSEFLVKKEPTTKDAVIKYGMIILTAVAAAAGLMFSFVFLLAAVVLGVACYFIVPRTDLEYEYLLQLVLSLPEILNINHSSASFSPYLFYESVIILSQKKTSVYDAGPIFKNF